MNINILTKFIILIIAMLSIPIASAQPVVIYNTFGPNDDYSTKNSSSGFAADIGLHLNLEQQTVANGFSVASNLSNIYFQSFDIALLNPLNNDGGNVITLALQEDVNGTPGTVLESFNISLAPKLSNQIYSVSSILNPELFAGQDYWLVASSPDPTAELAWLWNGIAPWGTNTGSAMTYGSSTNVWNDKSQFGQQAFRINASAKIVPLPATAYLFLLSITSLALIRKEKKISA